MILDFERPLLVGLISPSFRLINNLELFLFGLILAVVLEVLRIASDNIVEVVLEEPIRRRQYCFLILRHIFLLNLSNALIHLPLLELLQQLHIFLLEGLVLEIAELGGVL